LKLRETIIVAMRRSLSSGLLLLVGAVLAFGAPPQSSSQITRALLSVENLNLPAGQSLSAFRIETWGVSLLSVCHIPPSWNLVEQKYEDPQGFLSGRSDFHGEVLRELRQMYLIDVYDYQPLPKGNPKGEYHPATFSGWVEVAEDGEIAENGSATHGKRRTLRSGNFHLTPASRCPDAPPPQP
jgi:hypothetical protein